MARPSPSCAHDDDRLHFSPASPPSSNSAEKKESTAPRLSQPCPPCATPSSNSSLDYRHSDARIVENGFAASSGVSNSAKVVLVLLCHKFGCLLRAAQHGQRESVVARAATNLRRIVAIEFGTWRSGRNGGSSGLVTFA